MSIFISHSHEDSHFVDLLAKRLIDAEHHVWIDRWELKLGDSLIDKIQSNIGGADAVVVILSKNSVNSNWCKKELNTAMTKELHSGETLVMACVIDDCEIPLFLQDKLYADFSKDGAKAWTLLKRSLAKFSNPYQGRIEEPKFFTDWSFNWGTIGNHEHGRVTFRFIDHGHEWPYVIFMEALALSSLNNDGRFVKILLDDENKVAAIILKELSEPNSPIPEKLTIHDHHGVEKTVKWNSDELGEVEFRFTYQRLGEENDMDTVIRPRKHIIDAKNHFFNVLGKS